MKNTTTKTKNIKKNPAKIVARSKMLELVLTVVIVVLLGFEVWYILNNT